MVTTVTELDHPSAPNAPLPALSSTQFHQDLGGFVLRTVGTLMSGFLANATGLALALGASSTVALDTLRRDEGGTITLMAVCPVRSFHLDLPGQKLAQKLTAERDPNLHFCLRDGLLTATRRVHSLVGKAQREKMPETSLTVLM